MRKTAIGLLASSLLLSATRGVAAPATPAQQGVISRVVVYRDRAQVSRVGRADCSRGEAIFAGLPASLDTRTLRASIASGGDVIGVTYKRELTGPRGKAKELQKKVRAIDRAIRSLDREAERVSAVTSKLDGFRQHVQRVWGRQASNARPPIKRWDQALSLLRGEAHSASQRQLELRRKRRKLRRERRQLRRQIARIARQSERVTYRATVLLHCQGTPQVALHYVVPGATWRVTYQARANTQTGRIEMLAQAIVQQGTGEDWNDVRLAVSTANLFRSNVPPHVRQMHVSTYEPRSKKKVLVRRFERRRHLQTKTAIGGLMSRTHNGPISGGKRRTADSGLAMQLTASGRITVPSDGREVLVTLARVTKRAGVGYETVPKLFPFVYKRVAMVNPFSFPMLPGPIAIYRDGRFTGRSRTKRRAPGEPIKLSLGVENQLQVHRWVKEVKRYEPGTFGSTQRLVHRYQIQVGNWTRRRQTITVLENIPVSQVKEIKVELGDKATKPTRYDKTDGIATWEVSLAPRSKKKIVVEYTIRLPKSYVVRGYTLAH